MLEDITRAQRREFLVREARSGLDVDGVGLWFLRREGRGRENRECGGCAGGGGGDAGTGSRCRERVRRPWERGMQQGRRRRGVEFPGVDLPCVLAVQQHAEAFVGGDEVGDAEPVEGEGGNAQVTAAAGEEEEDGEEGGDCEDGDCEGAQEDYTGFVPVANGPSDEIWVALVPQGELEGRKDGAEGRWVGGVLKGVEDGGPVFVGEI